METPLKSSPPIVREVGAMVALLLASAWCAYVLTREPHVANWIAHPVTAVGLWLFLFPFRRETVVRRGIWLALVLIGVWVASKMAVVWVPFVVAGGIAYLLRFLSRALERIPLPGGRELRVPRPIAQGVLALFFVGFGLFLALGVVPNLARQTAQLAEGAGVAYREAFLYRVETVPLEQAEPMSQLGGNVSSLRRTWKEGDTLTPEVLLEMKEEGVSLVPLRREPLIEEWLQNAAWWGTAIAFLERVLGTDVVVALRSSLQEKIGSISEGATAAVGWLFNASGRLLSGALGTLLTFLFALIILAYGAPSLDRYLHRFFALFPEEKRSSARSIARRIDRDFQAFLRGQLVVMVVVAALSTLAYGLAGIPFPLVVGVLGGILNTIPNIGVLMVGVFAFGSLLFGTALGIEPPILFSIEVSGLNGFLLRTALIPVAVEAVQLIDNAFISPRVMSRALDVDPLLITFAVLFGGKLFGFWGVLFAVPCLVVVRAAWVAIRAKEQEVDV